MQVINESGIPIYAQRDDMDMRDYFAVCAMRELVRKGVPDAAEIAYQIADAMLKARNMREAHHEQ